MKSKRTQELIPCACGCGTLIKRWGESIRASQDGIKTWVVKSRERRYAMGHYGKAPESRAATAERFKGERNHNWKGGVTKERDQLKASLEYKAWAFGVYSRDRFLCQLCGCKCDHPEAHHIKPVRGYPELVLEPDNGITLCGPCHELTYGKEAEFEAEFIARVAKRVNSGNAPPGNTEGNPEPSQGGNASEGVETRGRAYPVDLEKFRKQEVPCSHCGRMLKRHPYRVKAQKRHFCSQACKGEWQRTGYKGQGSKPRVKVQCGYCGADLERPQWQATSYNAQYCGQQCMGKAWALRRWHGGNAPTSALPLAGDDIVRTAE